MRRTIAGLLFSLAYACACIAIAGFLLQRTAFDPDNTADAADVVLQDGPIRAALSSAIAEAATPAVAAQVPGMDTTQLAARVDQIAKLLASYDRPAEIAYDLSRFTANRFWVEAFIRGGQ